MKLKSVDDTVMILDGELQIDININGLQKILKSIYPLRTSKVKMETLSELSLSENPYCRYHPNNIVTSICRSPFCGYYREMCPECVHSDEEHKMKKYHLPIDMAGDYVLNKLREIERSFLVLKQQKQEKSKSNPITLPYQVKQQLSHIREIINDKFTQFERQLQQMYEKQVNMKLENLSDTIRKSLDFLKKELLQCQKGYSSKITLKKYFQNFDYWEHQRKYYKSYMQQILQKQVKKFKQGFDDVNIMKLIVGFGIGLKKIFSHDKQSETKQIVKRPHIFFQQKGQLKKCQLSQRLRNQNFVIRTQSLDKPYPKQDYKWNGRPQSIYYPDLECFYIFGEGKTASNSILKYEQNSLTETKKLSFIGQMLVKRSHFSLCLVNNQIFIIGGYNQKDGCLAKCEKMIVGSKNKVYLVSSLQQRSACHSVCNFRNKFILKFGGTSMKLDEKESYHIQSQIQELYPQIYDIQRQQWRVIKYQTNNLLERLQFGLEPLIMIPNQTDINKIIIFGNRPLQKIQNSNITSSQARRKQFQIRCIFTRSDVEMKFVESTYELNKKFYLLPDTSWLVERKNKLKVIAFDKNKNDSQPYLVDIKYVQ